jgi:hypothetical protein
MVIFQVDVFWVVMPYNVVVGYQHFRGAFGKHGGGERCLQVFGWKVQMEKTTGKT